MTPGKRDGLNHTRLQSARRGWGNLLIDLTRFMREAGDYRLPPSPPAGVFTSRDGGDPVLLTAVDEPIILHL